MGKIKINSTNIEDTKEKKSIGKKKMGKIEEVQNKKQRNKGENVL